MRKPIIILAVAVCLCMGVAGVSFAAVANTPHNISNARGVCANCHVPHLAGATRLWPSSETASPVRGIIGPLCYSCHDGTGSVVDISLTAWAIVPGGSGGSHGLNRTATGGVTYTMDNTTVSNALPYGNNTALKTFECTTCHDPHDDPGTVATSLSLLRVDFEILCSTCHLSRGDGNGTTSGTGLANANGTHPVGTLVTDNTRVTDPIDIGIGVAAGSSDFDAAYVVAARHELGGHLTEGANNSGVTCTSCHAVHGPNDAPTAGYVVPEDLLVVAQGVQTTAGIQDGFTANGGTGTAVGSPLCSGCHGENAARAAWNPGGTLYSHPANNTPGVIAVDIAAIPAGWPYSVTVGPGTAGAVPNCESCHKTHGATAATPILRATLATICDQCHLPATQVPGHHPVGTGLMSAASMADTTIGNGDANLTCADCHIGAGAHNWPVAGMPGLDPQWIPANNGRGGATGYVGNSGAVTPGTDMLILDGTSRTCYNCHTNAQGRMSPSRYTANANATAYGEYQDAGDGTHWLGAYTLTWTNGELNGSAFNATTGAWRGGGLAYSRFGGTTATPELVCESCHTLRIAWSDGFNIGTNRATASLLLYNHNDDLDETQSQFCQGCHGHDPGLATPHPMTADNVSKAVDINRAAGVTLLSGTTPPATSYQNAYVAAGNQWLPATANRMMCSSCHQTHDANTAGGTWILDVTPTEVPPPGTARTLSGSLYGTTANSDGNIAPQNYNPLCMNCHAY